MTTTQDPRGRSATRLFKLLLPWLALAVFPTLMWSWKLGKLDPLVRAVRGDCRHHRAPKDCPICTPAVAKAMGWCAGHGIPEAWCTKCHEELIPVWKAEGDFCAGHGIPESVCLACDSSRSAHIAELRARFGGEAAPETAPETEPKTAPSAETCRHTVAKSRCPICTPAVAKAMGWCAGHGIPEAWCTKCHEELIPVWKAEGDFCAGHGIPESVCIACDASRVDYVASLKVRIEGSSPTGSGGEAPAAAPIQVEAGSESSPGPRALRPPAVRCKTSEARIRLADAAVATRVGLETAEVERHAVESRFEAPVELSFDATRTARLAPRAAGVITAVPVELGEAVKAGQILVRLDSARLAEARAALLQAVALRRLHEQNAKRERRLGDKGVATAKDLLAAETALVEAEVNLGRARQDLRALGVSTEEIGELESSKDGARADGTLVLRAPFAGTIVERIGAVGEIAAPSRPILTLTDPSRLWAMLAVDERRIDRLSLGMPVLVRVEAFPDKPTRGTLRWVASRLDPHTRTLQARAVLENPEGRLRAGMFGRAVLVWQSSTPSLLIPDAAVQWEGCCNIAFVRKSPTLFEPRRLRLGPRVGSRRVVLDGLAEQDVVVTRGSYLLKTELLKSSIGAGCCEAGG